MALTSIENILNSQKEFLKTNKTKDIEFRISILNQLEQALEQNEKKIYQAIYQDFQKSDFDTFTTEMSFIYNDIAYYKKNIKKLSKPKFRLTNIVNLPASSKIHYDPFGNVLVIGAWNYPLQLSLCPAIAAITAGNTVVLKPSEVAFHTMKVLSEVINSSLPKEVFYVIEGGVEETTEILEQRFDKIFFTGSTKVGKIVYEAAAKHLTPVTLELGGKSPTIVSEHADLDVTAKRIVWGKFLNAGQTCVAPDYILVQEKVKQKFLEKLKFYIEKGQYSKESDAYTKIINEKNFDRLTKMISADKIYYGGKYNREERYIEPTILNDVNWSDAVMQEEIFGPILPILTYQTFDDALSQISEHEKPLASYLFSNSKQEIKDFTEKISFGGGCINDVVMHLSNHHLPFGGVGHSGMGNYHGKFGFETFSHQKAILNKATWGEPDLKYPPYSKLKLSWIKKLM